MNTGNFENLENMVAATGSCITKGIVYGGIIYEEVQYMKEAVAWHILKVMFFAGIILLLIGVGLLIYDLCKKRALKVALMHLRTVSGTGILLIFFVMLVDYLSHFGDEYIFFKWSILMGYLILMIILIRINIGEYGKKGTDGQNY